jgi:hypothetical protein
LHQWKEFGDELASLPTGAALDSSSGEGEGRAIPRSGGSAAVKDWAGGGAGVDVLLIDVEGWDLAVLQTLRLDSSGSSGAGGDSKKEIGGKDHKNEVSQRKLSVAC